MLFSKFGMFVVAGVLVFSSLSPAQESDYNDVLKQTLKEDSPPPPPPKRIVKKRIKKVVKKSTLPAKTTKVAQATDPSAGTTSVKVKETSETVTTVKPNAVPTASDEGTLSIGQQEAATPKYQYPQQAYNGQPYQPIFILQPTQVPQASPAAAPVAAASNGQVQPTTNVDSTTLPEPKSEQLRHQREDMEHQTENKLVEKLEEDRMKSEKDRAERLFAPMAAPTPAASPAAAIAPVAVAPGVVAVEVAPQPAPSAAPAPISTPAQETVKPEENAVAVVIPPSDSSSEVIKGETEAKVDDKADKKEDEEKNMSVGIVAGLPSYPTANNISSYYSLGAMTTYKFENRLAVQGGFDYSKFNIQNTAYCPYCYGGTLVKNMDQYDINVGLDYSILPGKITPVVGVLIDYARRSYTDKVNYGYTYSGNDATGSNAFNAGLMGGVDVTVAKNLVVGFQFAYLWNISYWTDDPLAYGLYGNLYGTPVESLSYYLATLNVRFMF